MTKFIPYFALIISIFGIASAPIFVVLSDVNPTVTLMLRMFLSSLIVLFLPIFGKFEITHSVSKFKLFFLIFLSSIIFCLDLLSNHWAFVLTSVTNATLLMNLTPFFTLLISFMSLKEKNNYQKNIAYFYSNNWRYFIIWFSRL
ncbi:EamA family transporter [Campylobacter iguaniorum]|uniref:EamA family transporter n=1 Tax=Campylobacter iguaniorum TaxID=1244531 RepID=UPI000692535C|nr:EamA family transporter [Campylobacter iguaniorum]